MPPEKKDTVILSVADLFFISKLKTALENQNCTVRLAPNATKILTAVEEGLPSLVILDLENDQHDPIGIVQTIRDVEKLKDLPILAYTNHMKIIEWEKKIKGNQTIVVSNSYISAHISDFSGLKMLFEDQQSG